MKTAASLFATALLFSILSASAGGFGGPGPFRNNSPLPTGTDGTYNASLRGANLSGVFRFTISNGSQGGDLIVPPAVGGRVSAGTYTRPNTWVAFYQGNVVRGLTDAAIVENKVSGTLDPLLPTVSQGITTGAGQTAGASLLDGGFFTGSIVQNSPTGSMKGRGQFSVNNLNDTIRTITTVTSLVPPLPGIPTNPADPPSVITKTSITGTDTDFEGLSTLKFTWRGARVSQNTQ